MTETQIINFEYVLKDDAGTVVDQSPQGEAMAFLPGHGNIIDGLEREILAHKVGESFDAVIEAKDAYGEINEDAGTEVPRDAFPDDFPFDTGLQVIMEDEEGRPVPAWIKGFTDEVVSLDFNHPMAGQRLHFSVKIVSTRDATAEELAHGHPHGPGGHHH